MLALSVFGSGSTEGSCPRGSFEEALGKGWPYGRGSCASKGQPVNAMHDAKKFVDRQLVVLQILTLAAPLFGRLLMKERK